MTPGGKKMTLRGKKKSLWEKKLLFGEKNMTFWGKNLFHSSSLFKNCTNGKLPVVGRLRPSKQRGKGRGGMQGEGKKKMGKEDALRAAPRLDSQGIMSQMLIF